MVHRILNGKPIKKPAAKPQGALSPLEVGNRRLFTIQQVREELDRFSREAFKEILALMMGAHPTEQNILDFANRNPDKWAGMVSTMSKLSGYNETIDVNHNIYATVHHMSDMDLEHSLREINGKIGDSHLVDPNVIETPYKRIDSQARALKRIRKT